MSRTASTAPTSWRCTCSGGTPCTFPWAPPTSRNARNARSLTQSETGARPTRCSSSPTCRPCGRSGMVNSTCLQPTPARCTSRIATATPSSCNRRGNSSSQAGDTPRARRPPNVMSPLIPAAGSRIAIRMGKWPNINGLAPVEPPSPGVKQDHAVGGPHGATPLELDGRGEGGAASRGRIDPFRGLELPRGGGERLVGHRHGSTAAFAQGAQHKAVAERSRHTQSRGDGPRLRPRGATVQPLLEGFHDGRAAARLHAVHPRQRARSVPPPPPPPEPPRRPPPPKRPPHPPHSRFPPRGGHHRIPQGPVPLFPQLKTQWLLAFHAGGFP